MQISANFADFRISSSELWKDCDKVPLFCLTHGIMLLFGVGVG